MRLQLFILQVTKGEWSIVQVSVLLKQKNNLTSVPSLTFITFVGFTFVTSNALLTTFWQILSLTWSRLRKICQMLTGQVKACSREKRWPVFRNNYIALSIHEMSYKYKPFMYSIGTLPSARIMVSLIWNVHPSCYSKWASIICVHDWWDCSSEFRLLG